MDLTPEEKKTLFGRLKDRYHLSIVNKDLLLEVYSRDISRGRLLMWISGIAFSVSLLTYSVIAFTPLKSLIIPGYESDEARQQILQLNKAAVELKKIIEGQTNYYPSVDSTLTDFSILPDSINKMNLQKVAMQPEESMILPDKFINFSISEETKSLSYFHFFKPISGIISKTFDLANGHFGIDVVTEEDAGVKSTLNGKVVLASWTAETGHIIAIQHSNELISIYKHNSVLLKKVGDVVNAGEVIALVGNSGEFTTGPHLHFELWYKGSPLNPQDVINFE